MFRFCENFKLYDENYKHVEFAEGGKEYMLKAVYKGNKLVCEMNTKKKQTALGSFS